MTTIYDVSFSNQPEQLYDSLFKLLHQRLNQPSSSSSRASMEMLVRKSLTVLIIDSHQERAHYIATLIVPMGYQPVVMSDALNAFTHFLQGTYVPYAVILGQEDSSKHFFLQRLFQQMIQKYDWEPLLMRLILPQAPVQTWMEQSKQYQLPEVPFEESPASFQWSVSQPSSVPDMSFNPQPGPLPASTQVKYQYDSLHQHMYETPTPFMTSIVAPPMELHAVEKLFSPLFSEVDAGVLQIPFPELTAIKGSPESTEKSHKPLKEKISLVGQSLGRYHIQEQIGSSAYSDVYKTYDRLREFEGSIKVIQIDMVPHDILGVAAEEKNIFQQESELLKNVQHPHILPVLNYGMTYIDGSSFVYKTMPYCLERSLVYWISHHGGIGSFQAKDLVTLVIQLADGLQYMHEKHILYQNFKMSNILVLNKANKIGKVQVALADFTPQESPAKVTTPEALLYMAPECWDNVQLPESDQYGLAAITYDLLTGRPPLQANSERILRQMHATMQIQAPSVFNTKLPRSVNMVLLRALAKRPGERYVSVARFAEALNRCFV